MAFQPASRLASRTYLGLIVAQFLAAFNDQCIHASAMFYAINHGVLTEAQAISLMPILFFAPWAVFCTLAGYLADRHSKRDSLVFWKVAEVGITLVALAGFAVGTVWHHPVLGASLVLSTVFLMGTHSAFFVPAKYGAMPEILQPALLSKGNGILESTSFLAVILGTVAGGYLSSDDSVLGLTMFKGREQYIGVILVVLAGAGVAASLFIEKMPAANPGRPFPTNLVKPLLFNLRTMLASRPLALSILGIAFFTFMVAFMRAAVYMHGETRVPHWDESLTSQVVATVALGVGLGSPLAGFLSGGKVELGLVPLGAVGMILALLGAAVAAFSLGPLIGSLILIGFFSGFYIVPLYTLLQQRAPKTSKGDLIATSNFINVTGAIAASLLFFLLVTGAHSFGVTPRLKQDDNFAKGTLAEEPVFEHGRPVRVVVEEPDGTPTVILVRRGKAPTEDEDEAERDLDRIELEDEGLLELVGAGLKAGDPVVVSTYTLRGVEHYKIRLADQPMAPVYDNERLPRYLFVGAACMTMGILVLLCRQLPDFFARSLLWLLSWGRYRLRVVGIQHVPGSGPVILATNCSGAASCLQVLSATDRSTRFLFLHDPAEERSPLVRYLAWRSSLAVLHPGSDPNEWEQAVRRAVEVLDKEEMVGLPSGNGALPRLEDFLAALEKRHRAPILPVYCGGVGRRVKVVIGQALPPEAPAGLVRREIERLAEGGDDKGATSVATTVKIPAASGASPTPPAADRPEGPSPA